MPVTFYLSDLTNKHDFIYKLNQISQGGGGGANTLSGLSDTNISGLTNGQILVYNGITNLWENQISTNTDEKVTPNTNQFNDTACVLIEPYGHNNGNPRVTSNITATYRGDLTATKHITQGGTSTQFVKGDGTLDNGPYMTGAISVTASESQILGYFAGKIILGTGATSTEYKFHVCPARPVMSSTTSSGYGESNQGVVRPQIEITKETDGYILNTGMSYSPTSYDYVANNMYELEEINRYFIPITFLYRYNSLTNRNESIPFFAINEDLYNTYFSEIYPNPIRINDLSV